MINRSAVTIAVGKSYYLNLAENLLLSFLLWNAENDIHFLLLTDNVDFFKAYADLPKIHIQNLSLSDAERSFTSKFRLFDYAIAGENLFIDCDCLVYGDIGPVFDKMQLCDFTAIGHNITEGSFFCDVAATIKKFELQYLPKFVGSIYYFKHNETAGNIFSYAKTLKAKYDESGFIRLRGKENEEPLLAVAMAIYKQQPIDDDGSIKSDMMFFDACKTNVLTGKAYLHNHTEPKKPEYSTLMEGRPLIVHFNDSFSEFAIYRAEQFRLRNSKSGNVLVQPIVLIRYLLPEMIITTFKNTFRPLYHRVIGPSVIKPNKRVL